MAMFRNQKKSISRNALRQKLASFKRDDDGNIVIMFVFMFAMLMLFSGGAVDFSRYNAVRADLIESMDAAGLAIAQYDSVGGPDIDNLTGEDRKLKLKEFGKAFFEENFQSTALVDNLVVDFVIDEQTITPEASGCLNTLLLHIGDRFLRATHGNLDSSSSLQCLNLTTDTEITRRGAGKIELALVLDVTGSMRHTATGSSQSKLEDLKDAVDSLLEVLYGEGNTTSDNVKVGVVPFAAYVNPGGASSWNASWGDRDALSVYHGARFFHVDEDGNPDVDTKVNHFRLYDSLPSYSWKGCVESRPYPLDEFDTRPGVTTSSANITNVGTAGAGTDINARTVTAYTRAPALSLPANVIGNSDNSRWVPMFWPDEPECDANFNGRCPWWENYSWWNRSQNITIDGSTQTVNFARYWFTDPAYDGQTEGDYENRHFIDDEEYIGRYSGEPTARYAHIVRQFQFLGTTPLTQDQEDWRDFLSGLGATDYLDGDISDFPGDFAEHAGDYSWADSHEYILRNAYVGWWNPADEEYDYKYDQSPTINASYGPEPTCPPPILPLTSSRTDVEDHMELLSPNGFTNTANGAVWGWRVISPDTPFSEGVPYTDGDWSKAVVIMTDGTNDAGDDKTTPWLSELTTYGFASEERMGVGVNDPDRQSFSSTSDTSAGMAEHMNEKMLRICHRMKSEGILVYTIVFGLEDADTEEVFQACATSPEAPYYYKAPSGDDLDTAFGEIAADLVDLHVSR